MEAVHRVLAWVIVCTNGIAGIWALAATRWRQLENRVLWGWTAGAEGSIFLQALVGAYLYSQGARPGTIHIFYGFIAAFAVVIVFASRETLRRRAVLVYGLLGLFLMGIGIRAMLTVH